MPKKFQNKYRISSTRLQNWDYRWAGAYFITICCKDRRHYFGEIQNGKMNLSNVGVLANVFWYEIKNHAQNVELGEYIIMPNHIHGILILKNDENAVVEAGHVGSVDAGHALPLQNENDKTIGQKRFQNPGKNSVSSIVGSYKSAVSKHANRLGYEFAWQSRFHDHIIRDQQSFSRITNYIINNPANWKEDKFYERS